MSSPERSIVRDGVAAALLFALLLEWLRPLLEISEWSGIYQLKPFMAAFCLFVVVDWLKLSPWLGWPIKLLICFGMVAYLFDYAAAGDRYWLLRYAELTMKDALAAADRDFAAISPDNRTLLFLLGWSMMIAVIYESVVDRKRPLWFVAVTLAYLLALQLWPGVNTSGAIIRAVWFGFLLVGLLQLSRLESRFALKRRFAGLPLGWLAAVAIMLGAAVSAGLWLPPATNSGVMKPLEISKLAGWNEPWGSLFLGRDAAGGTAAGISAAAKTGYGADDSVLGGPLRQDHSIAFTAATEKLTYWRGEEKTLYTGKGWESGGSTETAIVGQARTIVQEVTVVDSSLADRLFAGGPIERIERLVRRSGEMPAPDEAVLNVYGSYILTEPNQRDPLRYYRLKVAVPEEQPKTLPVTQVVQTDADGGAYSGESASSPDAAQYSGTEQAVRDTFRAELQLPANVPQRVKLLAETIALPVEGDLARARAIESFLQSNYEYRLDVAAPSKTAADFADTFLFESKAGYCDYFSTAMVVLLRSVDIPARWVKGFAPGERNEAADGMIQVTVRNSDAHSWVEAYIAGSGWVTFDPTPDNGAAAAAAEPVSAQAVMAAAQPDREQATFALRLAETVGYWRQLAHEQLLSAMGGGDSFAAANAAWLLPALFTLLLLLGLSLRFRRQVASRNKLDPFQYAYTYTTQRHMDGKRASAYRALDKLWAALFRSLGGKKPSLTVREYVESLPMAEAGKREALRDFVKQYETVRYGGAPPARSALRDAKNLWRRIK